MEFFCTFELDYLAPHDITREIEVGDIGAATIWGGSSSASVNNDTSNTKKKEIFGLCFCFIAFRIKYLLLGACTKV